MLYFLASFPSLTISSWQPSGKFIAEPTIYARAHLIRGLEAVIKMGESDHDGVCITESEVTQSDQAGE